MVTCFGEILWDVYPDTRHVGGAPFNVAAHLKQLGSEAYIVSRVGSDELGSEIMAEVLQRQVDKDHLQIDMTLSTGVVAVNLDNGIPSYDIRMPSAWDAIELTEENKKLVEGSSALVYGTLASRSAISRTSLQQLMDLSPLNICDLNIRQAYYDDDLISSLLRKTHILKINDEEADLLVNIFGLTQDKLYEQLVEKFSISTIIKTLGKDGAEVYSSGATYRAAAFPITVIDTVGSGDAFLAAFIHNYLREESLQVCIEEACRLGAYVATQSGAVPVPRS